MINFILGIALGAAFAPFWIKLWEIIKVKVGPYFTNLFKS